MAQQVGLRRRASAMTKAYSLTDMQSLVHQVGDTESTPPQVRRTPGRRGGRRGQEVEARGAVGGDRVAARAFGE